MQLLSTVWWILTLSNFFYLNFVSLAERSYMSVVYPHARVEAWYICHIQRGLFWLALSWKKSCVSWAANEWCMILFLKVCQTILLQVTDCQLRFCVNIEAVNVGSLRQNFVFYAFFCFIHRLYAYSQVPLFVYCCRFCQAEVIRIMELIGMLLKHKKCARDMVNTVPCV